MLSNNITGKDHQCLFPCNKMVVFSGIGSTHKISWKIQFLIITAERTEISPLTSFIVGQSPRDVEQLDQSEVSPHLSVNFPSMIQ